MNIKDLRIVKVYHHSNGVPSAYGNETVHYMHADQVARFVEATVGLHHTRGNIHRNAAEEEKAARNPSYVKEEPLSNLWKITSVSLRAPQTFWWTSPNQRDDTMAAQIMQENYNHETLWEHPKLKMEREAEEARPCPCCEER